MGAIAGIFARNGEPIDTRALRRMSAALQRLGPDGDHACMRAPVAMLCRPLAVDGTPPQSAVPLVTDDGSVVAWDGRLDNASEICAALEGCSGRHLDEQTLVLAAYRALGVAAFASFIGDFTLAIWDAARRSLVLCCDPIGVRSLSYRVTDRSCVWASTARAVLDATGRAGVPDEEYLASFIVNQPSAATAFRGIDLLAGGHALVVTATAARVERYWAIDPSHRIRHRSDEDYEAHFRETFETAVACRTRARAPVFCELSGGLDSTAIACVAARLHRAAPSEMAPVRTVSYVFPRAKTSDETPFIRIAESHLGAPGAHIGDDEAEMLAPLDPWTVDADFPTTQLCFLARHDRAAALMHEAGARVLLSGIGGDQMFWSSPPEAVLLADLAAEHRWRELLRATPEWARALGWPHWKTVWRGACWPLLPHRVQALLWRPEPHIRPLAEWLSPSFARRMNLHERAMTIQADDRGFPLPSGSLHYGLLRQTVRQHALGLYTTGHCVEMRYPFLDRRVVEFALATPTEQKVRPGETRSIVRRALDGILPDSIRLRRSKSGPNEAFYRALNRQWPWIETLLAEPRVCAHGVAAREPFLAAVRQARHGRVSSSTQLLRALSLEIWLRSLEHQGRNRTEEVAASIDARDAGPDRHAGETQLAAGAA